MMHIDSMLPTARLCLITVLGVSIISAQDPGCPAYSSSQRTELQQSLELDRAYSSFSRNARGLKLKVANPKLVSSANFIDQIIQAKMNADGVAAAPRTNDSEFLRRLYLDLTGRIPDPDSTVQFLNNADPGKRAQLIEDLLNTPAYADQLTLFFANRFQVTDRKSVV